MTVQVGSEAPFQFKQFSIAQEKCAMKVGTDGVLLGAWTDVDGIGKILDIGTGSGLIAVMLAQRTGENTQIHGVEIDNDAFLQAKSNMENSPWSSRLEAIHMAIQDFANTASWQYDLIVSNPPFFSGGTFSDNQDRASVRHTVKLPHGDLLLAAKKLLLPSGKFCVILPFIEGLRFAELAENYGFYCTRQTEVKPRADKPVERLLLQFEQSEVTCETDSLNIHDTEGTYSWKYVQLTGDFYLKM